MNINKENLLVVKAASDDKTRYAMNSVYFDKDGTVATNGYWLAKISYPTQVSNEDVPAFLTPSGEVGRLKPFIIASSCVAGLAKIQPKAKKMPVLENIYIDVEKTNANGSAFFMASDLQSQSRLEVKKMDAQFPPYEKVLPLPQDESGGMESGKEPLLTIGLDVNYVREACDVAAKLGLVMAKFEFFGPESPMKISGVNKATGQEYMAMVMPMRL